MNDQWLQYHYQHQTVDESAVPYGGLPGGETTNDILVPEKSSPVGNELSPRSSIAKPVRRRSRASRRTPTTLLNASIKNFRALVQQYTGCQSVAASSMKNQKGPINLSFGPSSSDQQNDFGATNSFGDSGGRYCSGSGNAQFHQEQNQQYYHQEHLQMDQGQQGLFPSDENNGDFSAFSSSDPNMMTLDKYGWH